MSKRKKNHSGNAAYIDGNTIRKQHERQGEDGQRFREVKPIRQPKKKHMSIGYMLFLCAAIVAVVLVLTWYVSLRSQITNSVTKISGLESQLNDLKEENDEAYNKANSNVDLEEIKRIAMEEYGMQYADENQVVTYSDDGGDDYVRQEEAIPDK